jgi:methanogenic corrinoid protein MtbC1
MDDLLKVIYDGVINGEQKTVIGGVQAALDAKVDPSMILNQGMIAAMAEVGMNISYVRGFNSRCDLFRCPL